jgi:hypothetical protein
MTRRSCFISFPISQPDDLAPRAHRSSSDQCRASNSQIRPSSSRRTRRSIDVPVTGPAAPASEAGDGRESSQQGRCCRHVGTTRASISGGSVCLMRISASISGASAGFRCRAEGQRREVHLDRGVAPSRLEWGVGRCTTRYKNAHGPRTIVGIRSAGYVWRSTGRSTRPMASSSAAR